MCYKKRSLRNPVKAEHRTGFDKVRIKVACCKCPSCRQVKSNDWLVRSYFEFLGSNSQAFFVTLDFDNDHLPVYNGQPCWDSEAIKHFFYRLRYYVGRFRYMYATDYGGFLKRPHYHMIIIPFSSTTKGAFFSAVKKSWTCGSHTDLQVLQSVNGSHLAAIQYVCGYVNKDIAYNPDDDLYKDLPFRYRPRVQASKGYGLRALEEGIITADQLLSGAKVSLPIGRNGKIVSLPIPRYYEMKLAYDYSYDPENRKTELVKNDFGVELAKARHNRCYVFQIREFFSSRHSDLSAYLSPGESWKDTVYSCLEHIEDFAEYIYYRPFCEHLGRIVYDNIRKESLYRPQWLFYERCYSIFENYKKDQDDIKCEREVQKLIEAARARSIAELSRNPKKYYYLRSKGFDFSTIFINRYV